MASPDDSEAREARRAVARAAAVAAGGPAQLAAELSKTGPQISSQAISQWDRVPAERALEVERLSGISRYELRPDVYGKDPALEPAE